MNATKEWPRILGVEGQTISEEIISQRYREMAKKYHPDAGGSVDDMQQLNAAKQLALRWIAGERKRQEDLKRAQEIAARHFAAAHESLRSAYWQQANAQQFFANQLGSIFGSGAAQANFAQYAAASAQNMANTAQYFATAKAKEKTQQSAPAKESIWLRLRKLLVEGK